MRTDKLTTKAGEALADAQNLALERTHQQVEPEHLLWTLLHQKEGIIIPIIQKLGKNPSQIISDLEKSGKGYKVTPHLYKFEEYGVPQMRHRVVIIGIRKDLNLEFKVPAPTTSKNLISSKKSSKELESIMKLINTHHACEIYLWEGKKLTVKMWPLS